MESANPNRIADVRGVNGSNAIDLVKVSAILNDLSLVTLGTDPEGYVVHWLTPEGIERTLGTKGFSITYRDPIPKDLEEAIESRSMTVGFLIPSGGQTNAALKELAPLVKQGVVIPRPERALIYVKGIDDQGKRTFQTVPAAFGGSLDDLAKRAQASASDKWRRDCFEVID